MAQEEIIRQFEAQKVRVIWDDEQEKYYFSVVDIIRVLNDSETTRQATIYWSVLKGRLQKEGADEVFTNCKQLKLTAEDGKQRLTDVADKEQLFRIIQSIPSKKAEPIKQWLAKVGAERLDQMQDPERSLQQMVVDYRRLGHDEAWINQRIKSIQIRKGLTDEWQRGGITEDKDFAFLTDIISATWSGMNTRQYKNFKGLRKENLRDNMTDVELMLSGLAEATSMALSKKRNPKQMNEHVGIAKEGGEVARSAREDIEHRLGESVISPKKAIDIATPKDELPFPKKK